MISTRILIVDDAADTREVLERNLSAAGYQVMTAPSVPEAVRLLDSTEVDLVITDLRMPRVSGLDLIRHVRENLKRTGILMITGYPSVDTAVRAVKLGAEDYLPKPFTDEELLAAVQSALDAQKRRLAQSSPSEQPPPHGLIGRSEAMQSVYQSTTRASGTDATVLITGESGTGKELVARAIHGGSSRSRAPFVPVNCGAIPESLLESELFGHAKGAFTGATDTRDGFFQKAHTGTIFLDEIGEMNPAMQVKLLRVLQDKEVRRVGDRVARQIDARILAATNQDLQSLVKKGRFREDLFYRLNVLPIRLPPLRERKGDIPLLVQHFLTSFAARAGREVPKLTDRAIDLLDGYAWPGNVRELQNVLQRTILLIDGNTIDAPDLPSVLRFAAPSGAGLDRPLADVEIEHIRNVLASVSGNRSQAAKILGIDRKTLRTRLAKLDEAHEGSVSPQ